MTALDKSSFYNGETIAGSFTITAPETTPPEIAVSILNAGLQLILKVPGETDANAIANLSIGSGITIVSQTATLITATYVIPGTATQTIIPTGRETSVALRYEINITYDNDTNSDVLEIGSVKIKPRVRTDFS